MRRRIGIFAGMGLFMVGSAFSGETAYQALTAIKSSRGEESVKNLVEIIGEAGHPQPDTWKMLFNDSTARGGVREIVVEKGAIASERTPVRGFAGVGDMPVLASPALALDSDKAFRLAVDEAIKANVGFHTVNYTLRSSGNAPVWTLNLYDKMGAAVGKLEISATTGALVKPLTLDADYRRPVTVQTDSPDDGEPSARERWREEGGLIGKVEDVSKRTGNTVKRTTLRVGGAIQEFFTGERTIDENEKSE